jgi:ribosomal protein L20
MNGVFHRMNGEDPRRFHREQGTAALTIERRIFADLATTDVHNFGHRRSLARSNQNVNEIDF